MLQPPVPCLPPSRPSPWYGPLGATMHHTFRRILSEGRTQKDKTIKGYRIAFQKFMASAADPVYRREALHISSTDFGPLREFYVAHLTYHETIGRTNMTHGCSQERPSVQMQTEADAWFSRTNRFVEQMNRTATLVEDGYTTVRQLVDFTARLTVHSDLAPNSFWNGISYNQSER